MMSRLYPTKNTALLDSFLEHKIENERLKRRIAELREEEQEELQAQSRARTEALSKGNDIEPANSDESSSQAPSNANSPRIFAVPTSLTARLLEDSADTRSQTTSATVTQGGTASSTPAATGTPQELTMPPPISSGQLTRQNLEGLGNARGDSLREKMARYEGVTHADTIEMLTGLRYRDGERSRGISTGDTSPSLIRGDVGVPMSVDRESRGSGERKKKIKVTNEYVCTDCGTLDSPEWRKGPTGPKTYVHTTIPLVSLC